MSDDLTRVIAEVRLRQYDSEYSASHLTWEDFTGEAQEIVAAITPLIEARVREAYREGAWDTAATNWTPMSSSEQGCPP